MKNPFRKRQVGNAYAYRRIDTLSHHPKNTVYNSEIYKKEVELGKFKYELTEKIWMLDNKDKGKR